VRHAGELAALVGVAVDVVHVEAARQEARGCASDGQRGDGLVGSDELLVCPEFYITFAFMVLIWCNIRKMPQPALSGRE
jgi:hypothetical protein